ncbi:MAG TPA: hypothetical protein G4O00_10825 [Thermoflexia bacterium]|nr:hypothetical protein [Thermoflexia bacterium]
MRRTAFALLGLGLLIAAVAVVSWFAFPAWRQTPGGFLALLAVAAMGVVAFVRGVLDVLKAVRGLSEGREGLPEVTAGGERSVAVGGSAERTTIITGDVHISLPEPPAPERPLRLRPPVPTFTGREKELEEITAHLVAGGGPITTWARSNGRADCGDGRWRSSRPSRTRTPKPSAAGWRTRINRIDGLPCDV